MHTVKDQSAYCIICWVHLVGKKQPNLRRLRILTDLACSRKNVGKNESTVCVMVCNLVVSRTRALLPPVKMLDIKIWNLFKHFPCARSCVVILSAPLRIMSDVNSIFGSHTFSYDSARGKCLKRLGINYPYWRRYGLKRSNAWQFSVIWGKGESDVSSTNVLFLLILHSCLYQSHF